MSKFTSKFRSLVRLSKPAAAPTFHVGPFVYTLSITPGRLCTDIGDSMVAWLESSREIVVSGDCPPERRRAEIMYGVMRAWVAHTGAPDSSNGWCDLTATAMEAFARDAAEMSIPFEKLSPAA